MRSFLSQTPERLLCLPGNVLDTLDVLVEQAVEALHCNDPAGRNEIAARILSLYMAGGQSPEEILELTVRLHREGFALSGRRSDKPPVQRIRTERQRRNLKENGK